MAQMCKTCAGMSSCKDLNDLLPSPQSLSLSLSLSLSVLLDDGPKLRVPVISKY